MPKPLKNRKTVTGLQKKIREELDAKGIPWHENFKGFASVCEYELRESGYLTEPGWAGKLPAGTQIGPMHGGAPGDGYMTVGAVPEGKGKPGTIHNLRAGNRELHKATLDIQKFWLERHYWAEQVQFDYIQKAHDSGNQLDGVVPAEIAQFILDEKVIQDLHDKTGKHGLGSKVTYYLTQEEIIEIMAEAFLETHDKGVEVFTNTLLEKLEAE